MHANNEDRQATRTAPAPPESKAPPLDLLRSFLRLYPFQPATALWRWFEVDALLRAPMPRGLGLDLGCGDGKLTQFVADRVGTWRLVGLDPDPAEIEMATLCPVYERLHCSRGDHIPEPAETFDFVFSNSVLEHIPDVRPVLREARRVIRPGGQLVLTVPSIDFRDCLAGPSLAWRALFGADRAAYLAEFDRRAAVLYYWEDATWSAELRAAGFQRIEVVPFLERSVVQRFEKLANATSGVLYKLFGGQDQPIEIQRKLGMRRSGQQMLRFAAAPMARVLAAALRVDPGAPPLYGCRLVRATT